MSQTLKLSFILAIAVLVSFCGMGYELLVIRLLSSVSGDSVTSQSVTAGCFLLALGVGAFLYGKLQRTFQWNFLIRVEIALAIVAVFALPILALLSIYIVSRERFIVVSQVGTVMIGVLSGFELPALMEAAKTLTKRWFGSVIAANYVGSLGASLAVPYWLLPHFGVYFSAWSLSLVSAAIAACLFLRQGEFRPRLFWAALLLSIFLPPLASQNQDRFEQFYLKSFYYLAPAQMSFQNLDETLRAHAQLPRIQRFTTPYQDIDIVKDDLRPYGLDASDNFHLFIDQHKQFGSSTEAIYHDTIVHGGLNLAGAVPSSVLVIGGGDGLIVRELLKYPSVKSITLVELDPQMIRLAREFAPLRSLNRNSLNSPKVHVEIADGFTWLRDQTNTFGAIFVDLPHPISTDLSRLYSFEFYVYVRRHLRPDGFFIFDFPFDGILKSSPVGTNNRRVLQQVNSAVAAAGFPSRAVFGSWESFMIAQPEKRVFKFDYDKLSPFVQDVSVFNMTLVNMSEPLIDANTIYKPVTLSAPGGGS